MATMSSNGNNNHQLRNHVIGAVYQALLQVCGGEDGSDNEGRKELRSIALSSISFPNKSSITDVEGKPHNVESKAALTLFHRRKRKSTDCIRFHVVSDHGLTRTVSSPFELASLIQVPLEEICRSECISTEVRCTPAGVICIVTRDRARFLLEAGRFPCPYCVKWCKGEKGLWWHEQQVHSVEHSAATASAASYRSVLSIVPFGTFLQSHIDQPSAQPADESIALDEQPERDVFQLAKIGDLALLKHAVENGCDPSVLIDNKGASPLLWAAGGGHLEMVQYLIEHCNCSPNQAQTGKRAFSGRTALHWAARNGHLPVVEYLIETCQVDMESPTSDGTTAFSWACWQDQLHIMKYLFEKGCNIHNTNSFGCNAVLWCAQGEKGNLETLRWLQSIGCDLMLINTRGHSILHKACQRGRHDVCSWFIEILQSSLSSTDIAQVRSPLHLVGPDMDGCSPSDLAGMEGHEQLAKWMATNEMELVKDYGTHDNGALTWLMSTNNNYIGLIHAEKVTEYTWEPWSGVRRMQSAWNSL